MSQTLTFQTTALKQPKKLEGFGGWLIFFAIGSVVAPVKSIATVLNELTGPGMAQAFQRAPVLMDGLLALDVAVVLLVFATSWAFFSKKTTYPTLFLAAVVAAAVEPWLAIGWTLLVGTLPVDKVFDLYARFIGQGIGSAIGGSLWFWYLKTSVRVRNTFVH
jgi:Protein of unknown function (DUF2569)